MFRDDALVVLDGDAFARVTELVHAFAEGSAADEEHRGVGDPEGVEGDVGASRGFAGSAELLLHGCGGEDVGSSRLEEQGVVRVAPAIDVLPDEGDDDLGDGHDAVAFLGLGAAQFVGPQVVAAPVDRVGDVHLEAVEVDVAFAQGACFSDAQAAHDGRDVYDEPVVAGHGVVQLLQFYRCDGLDVFAT